MADAEKPSFFARIGNFFRNLTRRQLIIGGAALGVLLLVVVTAAVIVYQKREALLASAIEQAKAKLARDYELDLAIDKAYFSSLATVTLTDVSITPQAHRQLVAIKDMSVSVRLWPLISGKIKLAHLNLNDTKIALFKQDSVSNYDFIFKQEKEAEPGEAQAEGTSARLSALADQMLNSVLYKIPRNMELRNFSLSYEDDSTRQEVNIPRADIDRGKLTAAVFLNDHDAWGVSGRLNPDRQQLYFEVHAHGEQVELPFLKGKYGLAMGFDTVEVRLDDVFWKGNDQLHIKGEWAVKNLKLNHWRIAQDDIIVPDAYFDAEIIVGDHHITLAETSSIKVKKLVVNPYFRYTERPGKTFALGLSTPEMDAQDLFDAFPKGLFESLEGIRVSGRIQYDMDVLLDTENPDSVRLNANMVQKDFTVNTWGKANIPKINNTFVYTPYENDKPVRDIIVGPGNPNFIPLNEISPNLRNAILTTEDPSFFTHEGFVEEAFRTSIAVNYKERAFKRGGSTISMQLVKNVFLNRNKTMVRKIEEIFIVWLMESTNAVSKHRMYEVYLNIIEWGRNVYGITEASRHYFGKHPSQLTIGESIYLASIVPRPKTGLYAFDYNGNLKPYLSRYFSYIGNIMARRGLTEYDTLSNYGFHAVNLREPLRPARPESADSLQVPPDLQLDIRTVEDSRNWLQRIFGRRELEN